MSQRAVVIERPGKLAVCQQPDPPPGPGQAKIRVAYAGICGSDRDLLEGSRPDGYVRYPVIPGHEWSGTVEAVGTGVSRELVGRPAVGEGFRACGRCPACQAGNTPLCEAPYDETGFTEPGAWAEHLVVPAELLHPLPAGCDLRGAALLEPAACAAQAVLVAEATSADRVAVVGGGTLGLLATQLLTAMGVAQLTIVDPDPAVADLALRCGATQVAQAAPNVADRFDLVIEAAGVIGSAEAASRLVRRGGRLVILGIPPADDHLSTAHLVTANVAVRTVFGAPPRAWDHAVDAFARGELTPAVLVTHEMALADVAEAFTLLASPPPGLGKILLQP